MADIRALVASEWSTHLALLSGDEAWASAPKHGIGQRLSRKKLRAMLPLWISLLGQDYCSLCVFVRSNDQQIGREVISTCVQHAFGPQRPGALDLQPRLCLAGRIDTEAGFTEAARMSRSSAGEGSLLAPLRLQMVRVALGLGWISAGVVVVGGLLRPGVGRIHYPEVVWSLVGMAAGVNGAVGLLPWRRWVERGLATWVFRLWAASVALLVGAFVYLDGGWRSDYYLLYFLLVPFAAATEDLPSQLAIYSLVLASYLAAVVAGPSPPVGAVVVRLIVLAGAAAVSSVLAAAVARSLAERAEAEAAAGLERLATQEAHHRIKNNLQLISNLLAMEAGKAGSELGQVVESTIGRIQSVAAVHQSLARRDQDRVALGPVVSQTAEVIAERLGGDRRLCLDIDGSAVEVDSQRAVWCALVVNELVTNALRHGQGDVSVSLDQVGSLVRLVVADQGTGPDGLAEGLGRQLVARLVHEGLGGELEEQASQAGYSVSVRFDAARPEQRFGERAQRGWWRRAGAHS